MKKTIIGIISILVGIILIGWFTFTHHSSTNSLLQNDTIFAKHICDSAKKLEQSNPDAAIKLYHRGINLIEKLPSDAKINHLSGIFYVNLANVFIPQAHYDSTIFLVNKALQITQNNDKEVEARGYNLNALVYLQKQEFDSANLFFNKASTIAKQINNKQILARTISGKAIIYCMQGDLKSGLHSFVETMKIGKSINDDDIIAGSCINIGLVYMNLSELDLALSYYNKALSYYKKHNLKNDQVLTYTNIGSIYYNLEKYSEAIDMYNKALKIATDLNDKKGIAKAYHNLGEIYKVVGDYNKAISFNFKALKIRESISDKAGVAIEYRLLAKLYSLQNNKQKTLYYHTLAFKIDSALSLIPMLANDYANMAGDLADIGEERKSIEYLQKSLRLYRQTENYFGTSEIYKVLGESYERNKKYDTALQYYMKSLDIKNQLPSDQEGISRLNITLSKFYANKLVGKTQHINTKQLSVDYGLRAYILAEEFKNLNLIADASNCLSDAYKNQGNYKKACEFLEIQKQANDSIFTKSKVEALIFGEARWSSEKKQHQISMLEKLNKAIVAQKEEAQKRHVLIIIGLIIIFLLISIAAVLFWLFKHKQRDLRLQQQLSHISLLRFHNIRNRISPHFIFNILNREISSEEDKEKHKEMIGLVKFLRRSLEITEQTSVTLAEELDFVKNYLQMEKPSLGDAFCIQWNIDNEIIPEQWKIPAMILQIPVENALKHALRPKQGEKLLQISILRNHNRLQITIQDNGDGYHPENIISTKGTGTGLKVLYQTIDVLNSKNKEKIDFTITDMKNEASSGTKVEISISEEYSFDL